MPTTTTVDERIVEMRIDHDKFEAGAKKTISILEKLDNSLSSLGKNNSDGLDQITGSLDKVTNKFSVMGTIGDQVIRNLTTKTMELVSQMTRLGRELTIDQVGAGWSKYADKTSAVQTIMAATAKDIGTKFVDQADQMAYVNAELEKLNWFTDETSYNFLDMVNNIGKFTANGRDLEESVTAMQGIATWAAISGGRVQQASQAMYNLSQALGVGAVTQMDWKSIENANMATYEFKQQVIETAEEIGNLVKVGDGIWQIAEGLEGAGQQVTVEGFRENLRYKWFDSDVLLRVLNTYGEFANVLKDVSNATGKTATAILQEIDSYEKTGQTAEWMLPYIEKLTSAQYDLGRRSFQAAQEAKTFAEAIDATKDAVSTKWMDIFETMFGDYMSAKGFWTQVSNSLWDIFAGPLDNLLTIVEQAFGKSGISGSIEKAKVSIVDFEKAFNKFDSNHLKELVDDYGSLEEAIAAGAVDAETYQKVLNKSVPTLTEQLKKAGYSVDDFQRSFAKIAGNDYAMVVAQIGTEFESFDDAVRQGAISVDLFRQIMDDLTGSADQTEAAVSASGEAVIHSLEDMVQVANDVWAGVYGNGEERKQQLEELGYDYETIQWIAGNINAMPWLNSAEGIAQLMAEFRPDLLTEVGEAAGLTEEEIAELAATIGDADALYAILTGNVELASEALDEMTGKDYFTGGLLNLLQFFADLGEIATKTFSMLLGGSEDTEKAALTIGDKIREGLLKPFYEFTEAIQFARDKEGEIVSSGLFSGFSLLASVIGTVSSVLGTVWSVLKSIAGLAFSGVIAFFTDVFQIVNESGILQSVGSALVLIFQGLASPIKLIVHYLGQLLGFGRDMMKQTWAQSITTWLGKMGTKIENAAKSFNQFLSSQEAIEWIDKKYASLSAHFDEFKTKFNSVSNTFKTGGIAAGFQHIHDGMQNILKDHPVLLSVFNFLYDILISIGHAAKAAWGTVTGFFNKIDFSSFTAFFDSIKIADFTKIFTPITTFFSNLHLDLSGIGGIFDSIGGFFSTLYTGLSGDLDTFKGRITQLVQAAWDGFINALQTIRVRDVLKALRLGMVASIVGHIIKAIDIFKQVGDEVKSIPEIFKDFMGRLTDSVKAFTMSFKANMLVKAAIAIGILAAAIYGLSKIDEDKLTHTAVVIGLLMVVLFKLVNGLQSVKAFEKGVANIDFKSFTVIPRLAGALIGLGVLILALGSVLMMISRIDTKNGNLGKSFGFLLGLVISISTIIGAFIWLARTFEYDEIKNIGKMLLAIGGAFMMIALGVQMMTIPLVILSALGSYTNMNFGIPLVGVLLMIGTVMAFLYGAMAIAKGKDGSVDATKIKAFGSLLMKIAGAFLIIALSVGLLVAPIVALAALDAVFKSAGVSGGISSGLFGSIFGIILFMITFTILVGTAIGALSKAESPEKIAAMGNTILKMAASLLIVSLAIQMLLIPVAAIIGLSSKFGAGNTALGLLGVVLMITALVVALAMLSKITADGSHLLKLAGAMALFAVAIFLLSPALMTITTALTALLASVVNMDSFGEALKKILGLGLAMLEFSLAAIALSVAAVLLGAGVLFAGAGILLLAAGLLVLGNALRILSKVFPEFVESMIGLGEAFRQGDTWKNLGIAVGVLLGLSVAVFLLVNALGKLFGKTRGKDIFTTLGDRVKTGLPKLFQTIKTVGVTGMQNLLMFLKNNKAAIITVLEGLLVVIGAYITDMIPTLTSTISAAVITLFSSIGNELQTQAKPLGDAIQKVMRGLVSVAWEVIRGAFDPREFFKLNIGEQALVGSGIIFAILKLVKFIATTGNAVSAFIAGKAGLTSAAVATEAAAAGTAISTEAAAAGTAASASLAGILVPLLAILAVAGAVAYAIHNVGEQQDILTNRAYGDNPHDMAGTKAAIEDTKKRMAELDEAMLNVTGDTAAPIQQEYDVLCITLKNLEKEYDKLAAASRAAEDAEHDAYIEQKRREREGKQTPKVNYATEEANAYATQQEDIRNNTAETTAAVNEESNALVNYAAEIGNAFGLSSDKVEELTAKFQNGSIIDRSQLTDWLSNTSLDIDPSSWVNTEQFADGGETGGKAWLSGANRGVNDSGLVSMILDSIFGIGTDMADTFATSIDSHSPSRVSAAIAEGFPEGIRVGVDAKAYLATDAVRRIGTAMINAFRTATSSGFASSGGAIASAISISAQSYLPMLYNVGSNLGSSVLRGFNERLRIHSPSREFMQQASYIPAGIAQGIESNSGEAIQSITILSSDILSAMQAAMVRVATVADDSFEFNPVITPVVDMSNLTAAADRAHTSFSGISTAMRGSIRVSADNAQYAAANIRPDDSSTAIVSEIKILSSRLDRLGDAVTNMQIVMDTGALVGATSKQMDGAFGTMQARRGRGN